MMNISECKDYINTLREEYIENQKREQERDELIQENNVEKRDIKGYHGREILELLQNADDAYQKSIELGEKSNCELNVEIAYKENILTIANTGTFFDKDGIKSIVQGNNSPKSGKYIGNKGTGFRSILNWANRVRIFSGNFAVEFSKEIANRIFEDIKNEPQIQKQIIKQSKKGDVLYIPMLEVPENIDNIRENDRTIIEIEIDKNKINDAFSVKAQIENIDLRILLFLPNINSIEIKTEANHITYCKKIVSIAPKTKTIELKKIIDGKVEIIEAFFVFNKEIERITKEDNELKSARLSLAVPCDFGNFHSKNLYTFFPLLDTESPFNCIMHATYELSDQRNTINQSESNKKIIEEQIKFLIEVSNYFIEKEEFKKAYDILLPVGFTTNSWHFPSSFSKFEVEDFYFDLVSEQKLLQTVNNELLSILDEPKIIKNEFPTFFRGEHFSKLLKHIQDGKFFDFVECLARRKKCNLQYPEKELCEAINAVTISWNIKQQVETFIWWNLNFSNSLPKLLKKDTENKDWLKYKEECYFLVGDFDFELPSWVKVPALERNYQEELLIQAEQTEKIIKLRKQYSEPRLVRLICQQNVYLTVNFTYRDKSNIIPTVNSSVDTYNKAVDFIKWLWKNYGDNENWSPPGRTENKITYNFPAEYSQIPIDSDKIFFGEKYNNLLAKKLFSKEFFEFPSPLTFSIENSEMQKFKDFVKKFGAKDYPNITIQEISPNKSFDNNCKEVIEKYGDLGGSEYVAKIEYELPYIENLETILLSLSMLEIIDWIFKDSELLSCLSKRYYTNGFISFRGNRQYTVRRCPVSRYPYEIKNYILETFNKTKWVEINNIRYSPRNVLQNFNSKNNQKFASLVPVIDIETINSIAKELNHRCEQIYDLLMRFDFCNKITDLPSNDFYSIMLKLPTLEPASKREELSKMIYRIVEDPSFSKNFKDSENKQSFFENGKLLVKYQGKLQFFPAKESYLPSQKIVNKKMFPIVNKGQRTNNSNFTKLFGCKEYDKEYTVELNSIVVSPLNEKFQSYFSEFQKFARAYAERNDNVEKCGYKLKITIVKEISILENRSSNPIQDDYACIRNSLTDWYITIFGNSIDYNELSAKIEDIYSNIANTPHFDAGKIGELFRAKEKTDKEFLIKKEFGSLDVIDDAYYNNEIKNNFIKALKFINSSFDLEQVEIDFENFYDIKNIPLIISLFKHLDIDIEEFENAGFVHSINLKEYYQKILKDFIQKEKRNFKNVLYTRAKKDKMLQEKFLERLDEFEKFTLSEIPNSVLFEEKDIRDKVFEVFGNFSPEKASFDADVEYKKNYVKMNPNKLFEEEIGNNIKVKTMIYFGKFGEFNKWLEEQNVKESVENDLQDDPYSHFRNVVPAEQKIEYHEDVGSVEVSTNLERDVSRTYSEKEENKRKKNQKIAGNKGELLIYNLLCSKYDKVYPRSEAYETLGILTPGLARSGKYDISYIDETGTEYFVEVKTSSDGKMFFMSPDELEFAKDNLDKYKLFLVFNLEKEKPDYTELPLEFWENKKFRRKDIVEKIEFNF